MGRFRKGRVKGVVGLPKGGPRKTVADTSMARLTRVGKQSKYGSVKGRRPPGIKTTIKGIGKG